eukprot:2952457-Ditylum_brightwellii.AAC.1
MAYCIASESTQQKQEDVMNNINARLTSLEDYVGRYFEASLESYPTVSIAIKEMIHAMGEHLLKIDAVTQSVKSHEEDFQQLQNTVLQDKQSSLHAL